MPSLRGRHDRDVVSIKIHLAFSTYSSSSRHSLGKRRSS
jgi:hypothetical protein